MLIYIITTGCYSSYSIHSVYTDKALAEEVLNTIADPNSDLSEWDSDEIPENIDKYRNGYKLFCVWMSIDGTSNIFRCDGSESELRLVKDKLFGNVWAFSKEHAIKIANEKRVMLIANGDWQ